MSAAYDNTSAIAQNTPPPSPGIAVSGNAPPQQPSALAQQAPSPPAFNPNEWEPVKTASQHNGIDLSQWEPVQQPQTTLGSIAADTRDKITSRLADQGKAQEQYMSGNMDTADTAAFGVKTVINTPIGIANDVIGGLIHAAAHEAPDAVKDKAEQALQSFLGTDTGQLAVSALQKGGQAWDELKSTHPDAAEFLAGIGNVGSIIGIGAGGNAIGTAAKETADVAGNALVDTAKVEYTQLKPQPNMGSKLADYAADSPDTMRQGHTMTDAQAQHLVQEQQKLDLLKKQTADASWLEPARQQNIDLQEAKVNQLREDYGANKPTDEAFRPAPEAPTPSPADVDVAKSAEQAPTDVPISEQLRKQASAKYNSIGNAEMPPATMNKFLYDVAAAHPQDTELAEAVGQKPEQKYITGLNNLEDKPLPLQRAKAIYEELGEKADKNSLDNGHLTNEGRVYQDMQSKLWDSIQGTDGTPEWKAAKKDWQQSIKLGQIERMQNMAANKGQPANSLRTAINNFVANPAKTRGWSDDEINTLKAAGQMGTKDKIMEAIGSKLLSQISGTAIGGGLGTAIGGPLGGAIGAGMGELASIPISSAVRGGSLARATTRVNTAKSAILKNSSNKGEGLLQQLKVKP